MESGDEILNSALPWIQSNNGCQVSKGLHGWSLVATKDFGQGDVILEERPVMLGPPMAPCKMPEELKHVELDAKDGFKMSRHEWVFALHIAFPSEQSRPCSMDPQTVEFLLKDLAIFAPADSMAAASFAQALPEFADSYREILLQGLLLGKFASFPLHGSWEGGRCLFGLLSKLNHSCYPNCVCLWPGKLQSDKSENQISNLLHCTSEKSELPCAQLRAVTHISAGEELTFSYLGNDFPVRTPSTELRRERLFRGFEFQCQCELCQGSQPRSYGELCRRALAYGKPPPRPKPKAQIFKSS